MTDFANAIKRPAPVPVTVLVVPNASRRVEASPAVAFEQGVSAGAWAQLIHAGKIFLDDLQREKQNPLRDAPLTAPKLAAPPTVVISVPLKDFSKAAAFLSAHLAKTAPSHPPTKRSSGDRAERTYPRQILC